MDEISDIQSVIGEVIKDLNIENELRISRIFSCWEEIVGAEISRRAKPKRLTKNTLYISVTSSAWASELSMMSEKLIDKINSFTGEKVVKSLKFKQEF
jgi:predicted nucleic acid-binding Zn ribbon protein